MGGTRYSSSFFLPGVYLCDREEPLSYYSSSHSGYVLCHCLIPGNCVALLGFEFSSSLPTASQSLAPFRSASTEIGRWEYPFLFIFYPSHLVCFFHPFGYSCAGHLVCWIYIYVVRWNCRLFLVCEPFFRYHSFYACIRRNARFSLIPLRA